MITKMHSALSTKRDQLAKNDKGFTLIELLVVVLIIGILAAVAIPIFLGQQDNARNSAVEAALTSAKTQIQADLVDGVALSAITVEDSASIDLRFLPATDGESFRIVGTWIEGGASSNVHHITDSSAVTEGAGGTVPAE